MEQKKLKPSVEELLEKQGYINYQYQLDAVNQALTIIDIYNGAIIADVVGLGKSIIAGMVAKHLGKRGMIICPPGLIGDMNAKTGWKKYMHDFKLHSWEVRSSGKLEEAVKYIQNQGGDIEIIVVDEAHKYRNQDTENYEYLNAICRNRQVLLLTATPFSNSPADIFSLLKLFIVPGKSKITLDDNLESRFRHYDLLFRRLSYITKYHDSSDPQKSQHAKNYYLSIFDDLPVDVNKVRAHSQKLADEIRTVLEPVLIRRNRLDLKIDPEYQKEIAALSDPNDPEELFFELSKNQSDFYDEVIKNYFGEDGRFKGAIYQPFIYEGEHDLDELDEEGNRQYQQQRNLYEFMRRLLVKRFESSFGSFYQSIQNFARVHKRVLTFIENSGGRYILDRNLIEKIYDGDAEDIDKALKDFEEKLEEEQHPKNERIYELDKFNYKEEFVADIKADFELMKEISRRMDELELRTNDPKAERLIEEVQDILNITPKKGEPRRKVIIFSEYVDTVKHLGPWLREAFQEGLLAVDGKLSATKANQLLLNFDASIPEENQRDQFQILLTSDKLSEGLNLNRAGAIINYDIPWNPTRVIQRVGRINRIGKKVFNELFIYNFFPTEKGSDIVKSRQTASHKMFLIHNTLGEDAKIFAADEEPSPSALFNRINQNPEDDEQENLLTQVRKEFKSVKESNPSIIQRIEKFPNRVKTAKVFYKNQLLVYRQKGLGYFVQVIDDTQKDVPVAVLLNLQESLPLIKCNPDENRLSLSKQFWPSYEMLKEHRPRFSDSQSANSIEYKALNNLKAAIRYFKEELGDLLPFARMLVKDLRDYRTLSKFSLRRLANNEVAKKEPQSIQPFKEELEYVKSFLSENYLDELKERLGTVESEIIIAIENQKR
jgi:superfamily II DNA or RNA helicase